MSGVAFKHEPSKPSATLRRTSANSSRMRAAPRPTNSSTNSLAVQEKKGTPASPATARASSVLPARTLRREAETCTLAGGARRDSLLRLTPSPASSTCTGVAA